MQDVVTPSTDFSSSEHTLIFPYRDSPKNAECSRRLQRKCHTRAWARQTVRLRSLAAIARIIVVIAPLVCQMAASTALELGARAQTATRYEPINRFAGFIAQASTRFAVPASWIRAVMQVESGGDERATSPRGAMGLMQLMPGTWVELSVRYELGLDPFDPSDNVLAGAAYLKEMHARFGSVGFLAAYHAGPARYEQHLTTGKSLPQDTIAYVAAVTSVLAEEQGELTAVRTRRAVPWREAPLFIDRADARN
ncbi:lytic transglycosylase domain-containing protein [Bradyrhizobium diazoefficiens]|jgi:soluble lytic murein transglycosylase-like protein|nr:lytic transglycosylase domain-containing protein [Bradyrhizobium diazoefficiens]MBR0963991.1 lytic transglycosylase domain-containing protein [Bradyrhizobium diazoefficiens]MBR0978151.1 lytic transglycosylase domain-containing protein [Bradyrhizobium diazoefficiens]MBR1006082.1 lytic transglycosylase domain-containing protein [Bradyrhizobium diazoefficiens]MBR1014134.1 lytic transglycosylase domain-containing protein [Bradyrhizobium diazoefficiens]MBR1050271.1 lytic transglycosylase domain-